MKIDILTLFPESLEGILCSSIIKRARDRKIVEINLHNIRDYSLDKNKRVDDYPYGGGAGMVLMCEPIFRAIDELKDDDAKVIMLTPGGVTYNQTLATSLTKEKHLILLCGHYEGFDERIKSIVDMQISIGDYILTGGELPAMIVVDSVVRLLDGVINQESLEYESFTNDLLDYPVYTKPACFRGLKVPEVLLSGHHANINKWRHDKQVELTLARRSQNHEK